MSDWRERLDEYGVPSDAVAEGVREVLNEQSGRVTKLQNAVNNNAFVAQNQEACGRYLQQAPEVAQRVVNMLDQDPDGAIDYLALKVRERGRPPQRGSSNDHPMGTGVTYLMNDPVSEHMSRKGYAQSADGYWRQAPGPSPEPPPQTPYDDHEAEKARAWQQYNRTGSRQDAVRVAKLRLREAISDDFLNA